jgi:hypothetical protein
MNDGFGVASAGIGAGGPSCSANSGQDRKRFADAGACREKSGNRFSDQDMRKISEFGAQVCEFRLRRLVARPRWLAQIRR